jgi:hypothetical protein
VGTPIVVVIIMGGIEKASVNKYLYFSWMKIDFFAEKQ